MTLSRVVFAYSGQGSQTYQMGLALFEKQLVFREWMLRLDEIARQKIKRSIVAEMYSPQRKRTDPFDAILLTHPAIFMVEWSLTQVMLAAGIRPDAVIGASLGEYCAAVTSGLMSWEDAFALVLAQAQLCEGLGDQGGMLAVLDDVGLYDRHEGMRQRTTIASYNFDGSFVISGDDVALKQIEADLLRRSVVTQRLPVRYAFHSKSMDCLKEQVLSIAAAVELRPATLPLVSCATGAILESTSREHLWDIVRQPIRVMQAVSFLEGMGPHEYVDVGPAGTFANLIKYNRSRHPATRAHALMTPFGRDIETLDTALKALAAPRQFKEVV